MLKPRPEFRKGKILSALIELAYVIDYKTTVETFKGNRDKMVEYYAIMTNSINNKYALSEDPVIRCVMVGLYTIKVIYPIWKNATQVDFITFHLNF